MRRLTLAPVSTPPGLVIGAYVCISVTEAWRTQAASMRGGGCMTTTMTTMTTSAAQLVIRNSVPNDRALRQTYARRKTSTLCFRNKCPCVCYDVSSRNRHTHYTYLWHNIVYTSETRPICTRITMRRCRVLAHVSGFARWTGEMWGRLELEISEANGFRILTTRHGPAGWLLQMRRRRATHT